MRILVTDGMDASAVSQLTEKGYEVVKQYYDVEELKQAVKESDALIVRSATKVRKPVIDAAAEAGRLKIIIRGGVGIDNIDAEYAMEKGIKVTNTPNSSSISVAELAIGHMFSVARFIGIANATMRGDAWEKKAYSEGIELTGKTLGLIGMGRIAREVAQRACALGMNVIYYDVLGDGNFPQYTYCSMEQVLAGSDFISLHVPGTGGAPLIGAEQFGQMKDGACFINTARGALVDEDALLDALDSGKIRGAGLDVYQEEPTKNQRLYTHPRVSVTPHIGAATVEAQKRIGEEIVSIITEFFG